MGEPLLLAAIPLYILAVIFIGAIGVAVHYYKKIQSSALLALLFALIVLSVWGVIMGSAFLFISEFLLRLSIMVFAVAGFFAVLFVDLIWRQRPSAWRMGIISGCVALLVVLAWFPESVIIIDIDIYSTPITTGIFEILVLLNLAVALGFGFHWLVASAIRAPKSTRHAARNLVLAGILLGPCIVLTDMFVNFVVALGVALLSILVLGMIVFRNPQLLYILPFTVYRLLVIDAVSGISIFNYDWVETEIDDVLLGGLLQGFQNISNDLLKHGSIREVRLDTGVLILHKEKTIFVGLLASKSSKFLEESLKNFAEAFVRDLYPAETSRSADRDYYAPASNLIKRFFSNIPENR